MAAMHFFCMAQSPRRGDLATDRGAGE